MGIPHILAVPFPAQSHVIPLMELVQRLANQGYKVTFVNIHFNHKRVMDTLSEKDHNSSGYDRINLVSIPDGLEPWEDRTDLRKFIPAIYRVMPGKLKELIEKINAADHNKITCVIPDLLMGWALEVAKNMGIRSAAFWAASATTLALTLSIPKLIEERIINKDGTLMKNQKIHLSTTMHAIDTAKFIWVCDNEARRKISFEVFVTANKFEKLAERIISNSTYELEQAAFTLFPKILPVGPLMASNQLGNQAGNFWPKDSTCLTWLDQQPACSIIYVALGSFTIFDRIQFQELALGLELTNKPFMWVMQRDFTDDPNEAYPEGFKKRIDSRGLMVDWAPQEKVLRHPSVACFLTHCGWNSIAEGVSNGVPFLCWPYFGDHFLNESYICDVLDIGLGFEKNERGIIGRGEVKNKVEQLFGDKKFKARVIELKRKVVSSVKEDGSSHKNLSNIIKWMK